MCYNRNTWIGEAAERSWQKTIRFSMVLKQVASILLATAITLHKPNKDN